MLIVSIAAAVGLYVAAMFLPVLRATLGVGPVSAAEWVPLALCASAIRLEVEADKWRSHRQAGGRVTVSPLK